MFKINNYEISENHQPYIIAELSANHNGSIERAKLSIKSAKLSGAHAVKIQTYNADAMTIDCNKDDFIVKSGLWKGYKLYDLYNVAHTPYEWHNELFEYANNLGITLFSTPFDESAVDLLDSLNAPAYKIASFELTDLALINYVAKKRKPMLMSTGMASEEEISEALEAAKSGGCNSILLFHCVSSYPAAIEDSNLNQIHKLRERFCVPIGLSDHTIGNVASIAAVALGACAIEKHFTLNRMDKGPDSEFSLEPKELKDLVDSTRYAWSSLGEGNFSRPYSEESSKIFRRSLYFVKNLKKGEKITQIDIKKIRPGYGIPPKYLHKVIGMHVNRDITRGDPVLWEFIESI